MPEVHCNGVRLHYTREGSGQPVMLLHGLGSRGSDWGPQIDALSKRYEVITLDFPGHGNSAPLRNSITMRDLADCVVCVIRELGLKSVHVIGLSLGGMVAFQLAVSGPELVRSMAIINSGPGGTERHLRSLKYQILLRKLIIRLFGLSRLARAIARKIFPEDNKVALRRKLIAGLNQTDRMSYVRILDAIGAFNLWGELTRISVPVLSIAAQEDYTPVSYKEAYTERLPNARVELVPDSRHATPMDQPDMCNRLLLGFLGEVDANRQHPAATATETGTDC